MIYTFQSKASGSVIMTASTAQQIFKAMGRALEAKGILTVEQLPEALASLRRSVEADKAAQRGAPEPEDGTETAPGLAQRAFTFLELLDRAKAAGHPVVWGV